jgi:hypothetical protein
MHINENVLFLRHIIVLVDTFLYCITMYLPTLILFIVLFIVSITCVLTKYRLVCFIKKKTEILFLFQ